MGYTQKGWKYLAAASTLSVSKNRNRKEVLTTAMRKQSITESQTLRIIWDNLEDCVGRKVQEFIQSLLEEEITELLRRQKSERRKVVDGSPSYGNGYGKERMNPRTSFSSMQPRFVGLPFDCSQSRNRLSTSVYHTTVRGDFPSLRLNVS